MVITLYSRLIKCIYCVLYKQLYNFDSLLIETVILVVMNFSILCKSQLHLKQITKYGETKSKTDESVATRQCKKSWTFQIIANFFIFFLQI